VREEVREAFDVDVPVLLVDLDVGALQQSFRERAVFAELPRFPAVKRDLSLVVPRQVTYADVEGVVRSASGALLEHVSCFDVFQEKENGNHRSLGLRLRFRSADRTLTDEMVEPQIQKILRQLEATLKVVLRVS
jgi:phenylalanyl-tRNA synthetase beta chain